MPTKQSARRAGRVLRWWLSALALLALTLGRGDALAVAAQPSRAAHYERAETRALVELVDDAAKRVRSRGEAAFEDFRRPGSRWRSGDSYVFVLDRDGDMLVHPDPALEGGNVLDLVDVDGKPIIRGLLATATAMPDEQHGWYHYRWPVPGGLLPRWKSSYVTRVKAPSGEELVVGGGMYDDRMERAFVVDMVDEAVGQIEKTGTAAFPLFRDHKERFLAKDAYVFVLDPRGVDLVNPAFPNLEGRSLRDVEDTEGKKPVREMLEAVRKKGEGWVDYMWPKPGDSVSTQKSAYVRKAKLGDTWVLVGAGVYLADAPKAAAKGEAPSADALRTLVRDGAATLEAKGEEAAYAAFGEKGSKWLRDDTYLFVWDMDGVRTFHAADPSLVGTDGSDTKDVRGRPYGEMILDAARSSSGEGWVHYMFPKPGEIFPAWKSTFVKRVTLPSGERRLVGAGIYDMQLDETFVKDVVDRAAALVARRGRGAFAELRDEKGPFRFMDTYVFVDTPEGIELVNGGQPSLEGRGVLDLKDASGELVARKYIGAALERGDAWVDYRWYKPGENTVARKKTYVRKVQSGKDVFVIGSGFYAGE